MDAAGYRALKTLILSALPVSGEALAALAGLGCYLATCLVARRPLAWAWGLAPGFVLSLAVEGADIWTAYGAAGGLADASTFAAVLARHLADVAIFNAAPVLILTAARLMRRRRP